VVLSQNVLVAMASLSQRCVNSTAVWGPRRQKRGSTLRLKISQYVHLLKFGEANNNNNNNNNNNYYYYFEGRDSSVDIATRY